ncbi:MAG: NfeD family protein [bacterium]
MSTSNPSPSLGAKEKNNLSANLSQLKRFIRQSLMSLQKNYLIPMSERLGDWLTDPRLWKERLFSRNTLRWIGIGAGLTGLLMLLNPTLVNQWQLLLIPVIAFFGANIFALFSETSQEARENYESYQGQRLLGKVFTLEQAIVNGTSSMNIDGQIWTLCGNDCAAETQVKVIAVSDNTLHLAPYQQTHSTQQPAALTFSKDL